MDSKISCTLQGHVTQHLILETCLVMQIYLIYQDNLYVTCKWGAWKVHVSTLMHNKGLIKKGPLVLGSVINTYRDIILPTSLHKPSSKDSFMIQ